MSKNSVDLIIRAPWTIPVTPQSPILEDAAIAIRNGQIIEVGPSADIQLVYQAAEQVELTSHILLPGLINAHGHAAMSLFRGHAEDTELQAWLHERIWPLEARWVDADFVRDGTRLAIAEMLHSGITCFSDMYFFPEVAASEAKSAGMRAQVAFPVIEFANAWSQTSEEGVHKGLALHDLYRNDPHIHIAFGPHSVYSIQSADLDRILMYSEELDINIQIHLHENAAELATNRKLFGTSGVHHLHQHQLLSPRLQAVHMTQIEDEELVLLAENNVQVVHCPTSNAKLASGVCPVTDLIEAGVNVCLGTDGAAANNCLDLLGEARLASLMAKLRSGDAAALPAKTVLEMATINGAKALGLADRIGSLEPGKAADIIAVDISAPAQQPLYDPLAQLIHSNAGQRVSEVWVDGIRLMRNGALTQVDESAMFSSTAAWQQKIRNS